MGGYETRSARFWREMRERMKRCRRILKTKSNRIAEGTYTYSAQLGQRRRREEREPKSTHDGPEDDPSKIDSHHDLVQQHSLPSSRRQLLRRTLKRQKSHNPDTHLRMIDDVPHVLNDLSCLEMLQKQEVGRRSGAGDKEESE